MSYKMPVFLSYPKPHLTKQDNFILKINELLATKGFSCRTLGVTDYDMDEPLTAIRRLLLECHGVITVAFRRTFIKEGFSKHGCDNGGEVRDISGKWITSPYSHIEAAMAFQIGLPVLVFREKGVMDDGILEKGILGTYLPEFDLESATDYLTSNEWNQIIGKWEGNVRKVVETKGKPPKLY